MLNLEKTAGLPIEMRDDYSLVFDKAVAFGRPTVQEFSALKNYLKDPSSTFSRRAVYTVYRDVGFAADLDRIHTAGLQYDLTVMPPGKIGDEFVKTIGHYHPYKPGTAVRYPEVYEVVSGQVFWLLQSASEDLERLREVYLLRGKRGDKLLTPPGFGHVSINPGDEALILGNWQPLGNQGIYEPYEIHNGGAYYVIESERLSKNGKTVTDFEFTANLHYSRVPPLREVPVREFPQYDLRSALPMYFTVSRNPESLDFLLNPENYLDELLPEKLFK